MPSQSWTMLKDHSMNGLNISIWTYKIKQISAGLYVLQGGDNRGHQVNSIGTDSHILEEEFFEAAQKIDRSARVEANRQRDPCRGGLGFLK